MSGYFWVTIESCVLLGWQCCVYLLDGMQWPRPSLVGVVVCMVRICMVEATSGSRCCCAAPANHGMKASMEAISMAYMKPPCFSVFSCQVQ
jgi:hypothetical protein